MIDRSHVSVLAAALALVITACGGGSGGGAPGKLSEALLDAIHHSCENEFDCKSSYIPAMHNNQTFENFVGGSTVDACVNTIKTLILTFAGQDFFTKLDASVMAGRIKYNPADYETCLAAAEAETCDQVFEQNGAMATPPAACDTFQVGQVPHGGNCTLDADCAVETESCDSAVHTCG